MRSLSKLALNSFYGKFGQRNNMNQSQTFNELGKLMNCLNYKSSLVLNFESMKEALMLWHCGEKPKEPVTIKTELLRDRNKAIVFNRVVPKHYGVVYDKRRVLPDFTTLPFGFKK